MNTKKMKDSVIGMIEKKIDLSRQIKDKIDAIFPDHTNAFNVDLYEGHIKRGAEWTELAEELHEAQQMIIHFTNIKEGLKDKLMCLSENESSKGGDFTFTRYKASGHINYKKIPELSRVDLDAYRKDGFERWKLTKI